MKIPRSVAVGLFVALKFQTAGKWPNEKLKAKLEKIEEHVEEEQTFEGDDAEKNKKALAKIQAAIAKEEEIEVVDDAAAPAAPAKAPAKAAVSAKPAKKTAPVEEEAEETEAEEPAAEVEAEAEEDAEEAPPAKPAKKATTTAAPGGKGKTVTAPAKVAKAAKEKPEGPEGVRASRSRPYIAGIVIKKHGMAKGITKEMIDEVNAAYGTPNDVESRGRLVNGWHSIRGFITKNNEGDLELPTGEATE